MAPGVGLRRVGCVGFGLVAFGWVALPGFGGKEETRRWSATEREREREMVLGNPEYKENRRHYGIARHGTVLRVAEIRSK